MLSKTLPLAVALAIAPLHVVAQDIAVTKPFARETTPSAKVGGAFMTLMNSGADDVLVGGKTDAAKCVELHSHTMDGGIMKMREVEGGIPLPSGEHVMLKPGGLHVMLMDLTGPLKRDKTISLELQFQNNDPITVEIPIVEIGAMNDGSGHMTVHQN